jgi:hypothetical protein
MILNIFFSIKIIRQSKGANFFSKKDKITEKHYFSKIQRRQLPLDPLGSATLY